MEMMASIPTSKVQTLIFCDMESTGLPHDVGLKNVQITEIALLAIDRAEFENSQGNIRVINKLNLCLQPRSRISSGSIHLTGLCNMALQFQERFSQNTVKLIELFLQRLNKPVCLLAHNGDKFDFPLLKAEILNSGEVFTESLFCADTLNAFRSILSTRNIPKNVFPSQTYTYTSDLNENNIEEILSQDLHIFDDIEILQYNITEDNKYNHNVNGYAISTRESLLETISPSVNESTPKKVARIQSEEPKLHRKNGKFRKELFNSDAATPKQSKTEKAISHKKNTNKMSYKLSSLYEHFFNCSPQYSHLAEADSITLLKTAQAVKNEFLPWIDEHKVPFDAIKPMW